MEKTPLRPETIKVKRASPHKFAERLGFCFWRLKENISFKLWRICSKYMDTDFGSDEGLYSLDDSETQALFEKLDREEQEYIEARPSVEPKQTALIYAKNSEHSYKMQQSKFLNY